MDSNIIQTSKAVSKRFTKGNFTKIRCQSFRITDSSGYIEKKNPEYSEMKPKKKTKPARKGSQNGYQLLCYYYLMCIENNSAFIQGLKNSNTIEKINSRWNHPYKYITLNLNSNNSYFLREV